VIKLITLICGFIQTLFVINILYKIFFKKLFSYSYTFLLIYYIIFTLPLLMDVLMGIPNYSNRSQILYEKSSYDKKVIFMFNFINVFIYLILWKVKKEFPINLKYKKNRVLNAFLIFISVLPIILVIININNIPSFKYASLMGYSKYNAEIYNLYNIFLNITLISVPLGMLYIILNPKRHIYITFIIYLSILVGIYINGKRLIVFLFFILLIVNMFINNRKKFFITILCSVIFVSLFNIFYSNYLDKEYGLNKFSNDGYLQFRIDYSRDHNVKMILYKELNKYETPVLEYRGQSFIFNLTFFIPRNVWEDKPYPYGVYVTSSSLGLNNVEDLGWQMTTSLLDECIANFGIPIGILFFILVFLIVFKIGFAFKDDTLFFALTNLIILLLLTMQFSFYAIFILLWGGMALIKYINRRYKFSLK